MAVLGPAEESTAAVVAFWSVSHVPDDVVPGGDRDPAQGRLTCGRPPGALRWQPGTMRGQGARNEQDDEPGRHRFARTRDVFIKWVVSPITHTDALQYGKATAAAVVAWVLADTVLGLHQAFLAPWVALLTMHATVQRTLRRGVETVASVGAGIVLSFVILQLFGASIASLTLALLAGLALAQVPWLRHEGTLVATTALFVITTGETASQRAAVAALPARLLDTALGVAVALLVNLIVVPPLDDQSAEEQVDKANRRLGRLLTDIAAEVDRPRRADGEDTDGEDTDGDNDWIARTRSIDADLNRAWSLVSLSHESRRLNPRRRRFDDATPGHLGDVLLRLEEGVAQTRSIARHVLAWGGDADEWEPLFRDRYLPLLTALGRAVADPSGDVAHLRGELDDLTADLWNGRLPESSWPRYGALLANTRMIVDVVDDVASARPVRT